MSTVKEAVVFRFQAIMQEQHIRPNELAVRAGVTPSSVYSMLDPRRKEITINLIKKLCDGLDITLCEFFFIRCIFQFGTGNQINKKPPPAWEGAMPCL